MKRILIVLAVAFAGIGCASAAERGRAREIFRQLDTDGDRKIAFTEIQAARAKLFDRMDTNRDGILDAGEMQAAAARLEAGREKAAGARLANPRAPGMDSNGDGRIARAEFAAFVPDRLLKADRNNDRMLSLPELRSLRP